MVWYGMQTAMVKESFFTGIIKYNMYNVQCNKNDIDSPINGLFKEILAQEPFIFELIVQIFNNTI